MVKRTKKELPNLKIAWYGDDFTGSVACMEVLAFAGYPAVVFLNIPSTSQVNSFNQVVGLGIAGIARAKSSGWISNHLGKILKYLYSLRAPITHYKVCSTMDSSPRIGSIGKAIEVAQTIFKSMWVPVIIAAPPLRRFQFFGNLFASAFDRTFRLDRHPVMKNHPVTPITESDVISHLSKQTNKKIDLLSFEDLSNLHFLDLCKLIKDKYKSGSEIVAIDLWDSFSLKKVGKIIESNQPIFVVGSQGVQYSLVEHWQTDALDVKSDAKSHNAGLKKVVVVSGSVSTITANQIQWALKNGFKGIKVNPIELFGAKAQVNDLIEATIKKAVMYFKKGIDPIIHTAIGPTDSTVRRYKDFIKNKKIKSQIANQKIGQVLGVILKKFLEITQAQRAIVSGGDTCGYVLKQLDIYALTVLAPTVPGAALYKAFKNKKTKSVSEKTIEIALKGGQMGTEDYFGWIRSGGGIKKNK